VRLRIVRDGVEQLVVEDDPDPSGWALTARFEVGTRKTVIIRSIEISPPEGQEVDAVDGAVWRRLNMVDFQRRLRAVYPIGASLRAGWPTDLAPGPRPGRAGRPVEFYADWVGRYVDALTREPRRPIKLIVDEARAKPRSELERRLQPSDVRRYLDKAETLGLITGRPKATEGRAGGHMTPKCRTILKEAPDGVR